jgi:carboxyl-terminal processing protease
MGLFGTIRRMRAAQSLSAAVTVVVVSALVGGLFGGRALATQDRVAERYKVFSNALAAIEANYVEEVDTDRLVYGAINGMLQTLDPHSSFMDPRTYSQMRERQEGRYYGLGITIQVLDGDITVMALFDGSPAYLEGVRRGDVIAEIEGESAAGWTSDQAVARLRGPKGSPVNIAIRRQGYDALIPLEVTRDEINIPTILGAFMVNASTGYVRLRDFSETTDHDLGLALEDLAGQGMQQLLLDLRDNPGGPLDQAIRVANRFLPRGDMIVYTRGRIPNSDQDYHASEESDFTDLPLVVLVNRNSASASEIVAGAIQDHDRGLIAGETTFGKALVQSIYRVSEGAGLALTTARYYTPSGRLIQRPWDGTFDEYLTYSMRDQEADRQHSSADLKYTDAGRQVYSGGGIEPDDFMAGPVEGFDPTPIGRRLFARQAFARYAQKYSASGDTRIREPGRDLVLVDRDFEITDEIVDDFMQFLAQERLTIDAGELSDDALFVRAMIRYYIDLDLFGVLDARRHLVEVDPQAMFALTLFGKAEALTRLSRPGQPVEP